MISRREALMQQGMQNILGGFKSYADTKRADAESKRRQALEGLAYAEGLAGEGYQMTPEAQDQIFNAFSTGQFGAIPQLRSTLLITDQERQRRELAAKEKEMAFKKSESEMRKAEAEIKEIERKAQGLVEPTEMIKLEDSYRKEDQTLRRTLDEVSGAYNMLSSTVAPGKKLNSPQELSSVINFLRTVNPAARIRPDDMGSVVDAAGFDMRIANAVRDIVAGQSLDPQQVRDMLTAAQDAVRGAARDYEQRSVALRSRVKSVGANPMSVFGRPLEGFEDVGQSIIGQQQQIDPQKVEQAKRVITPEQAAQELARRRGMQR